MGQHIVESHHLFSKCIIRLILLTHRFRLILLNLTMLLIYLSGTGLRNCIRFLLCHWGGESLGASKFASNRRTLALQWKNNNTTPG